MFEIWQEPLHFQSHLGLISTWYSVLFSDIRNKLFQSHLGLISTFFSSSAASFSSSSFNPTLVWFQLREERWRGSARFTFQSHLGLISTHLLCGWRGGCGCFQSHLGLISTELIGIKTLTATDTFNPTLVWFQRFILQKSQTSPISLSIPPWSDFNAKKAWNEAASKDFQSHLGLISTQANRDVLAKLVGHLSIPPWSDFNTNGHSLAV